MSAMSFCRAPSLHALIPKSMFDEDLSWGAKGVLAYLLAADKPEVPKEDPEFAAVFAELKEKGFIVEYDGRLVVKGTLDGEGSDPALTEPPERVILRERKLARLKGSLSFSISSARRSRKS